MQGFTQVLAEIARGGWGIVAVDEYLFRGIHMSKRPSIAPTDVFWIYL